LHKFKLKPIPFLDIVPTGIFCTRSPDRPNSIGISDVKITKIYENIIEFEGADMLDGPLLIDVKPFIANYPY